MKLPKYVRIQGREIAWRTKKPVGVFILNWRRIRDNIYSPEDVKLYDETHQWFLDNLPQPPFYGDNNDNPQGALLISKQKTVLRCLNAYSRLSTCLINMIFLTILFTPIM